jgi:hypothetical protein
MEEPTSKNIIKLTSSNYVIWKPRMEDLLYDKDLYESILVDSGMPVGLSDNT